MSTRPDDVASWYWLVSSGPSDIQMTKMPRTFRNGVYLLKWGRGLVWGLQGAKRGCDLFLSAFVSCRKRVWKFDSLLMWRALWPLISFLSWLSRGALIWSRPLKVLFAVNKTLLENFTCMQTTLDSKRRNRILRLILIGFFSFGPLHKRIENSGYLIKIS